MNRQEAQLILVPTPIGNLGDMSPRACEVLREADLVAAEDTRVTARLLAALGLPEKKLISYHSHNEKSREELLLEHLRSGLCIALVSDAGMPAISDPGEAIVRRAAEEGFTVSALPGPNAALTALSASGFNSRYFYFEGFLPSSGAERRARLSRLARQEVTAILYEAPHRLAKTLEDLCREGLGKRRLCLARELTKTYETYTRQTVEEALTALAETPARGEYVLILEGSADFEMRCPEIAEQRLQQEESELGTRIRAALAEGKRPKEILKQLLPQAALSRNQLYELILSLKDEP